VQLQYTAAGDGIATAALSHQLQGFPAIDVEADTIHCLNLRHLTLSKDPLRYWEMLLEVFDFDHNIAVRYTSYRAPCYAPFCISRPSTQQAARWAPSIVKRDGASSDVLGISGTVQCHA